MADPHSEGHPTIWNVLSHIREVKPDLIVNLGTKAKALDVIESDGNLRMSSTLTTLSSLILCIPFPRSLKSGYALLHRWSWKHLG